MLWPWLGWNPVCYYYNSTVHFIWYPCDLIGSCSNSSESEPSGLHLGTLHGCVHASGQGKQGHRLVSHMPIQAIFLCAAPPFTLPLAFKIWAPLSSLKACVSLRLLSNKGLSFCPHNSFPGPTSSTTRFFYLCDFGNELSRVVWGKTNKQTWASPQIWRLVQLPASSPPPLHMLFFLSFSSMLNQLHSDIHFADSKNVLKSLICYHLPS